MNTKTVYLVELDYEAYCSGERIKAHDVIGVFESVETAVKYVRFNAADDLTIEEIKDALASEGMCEIWQHPCMMGDKFAKRIYATISEQDFFRD